MSTDDEWEKWGRQDPYFGVITDARFRAGQIDDEARAQFFAGGASYATDVLATCRRLFGDGFAPGRILDFGCGVGRVVIPFARACQLVVGVDVSRAMLDEAERNCSAAGVRNVALVVADDELSQIAGDFDLVHSVITLQHIEALRTRTIFARLLEKVAPGGVGAIQLTYAKAYHPDTLGQPPPPPPPEVPAPPPTGSSLGRMLRRGGRADEEALAAAAAAAAASADPEMLMIPHPLNELLFLMQRAGVRDFHTEFTDHGGELGVFFYFRKEPLS